MTEETTKKIIPLIILGFIILFIVLKNNSKKDSIVKNAKYTVVEISNAEVFGKNFTKYTFSLSGRTVYSYGNRLLGKNVLIEYDSTNIENSNIFINVHIPDNIHIPNEGWKSRPIWAN